MKACSGSLAKAEQRHLQRPGSHRPVESSRRAPRARLKKDTPCAPTMTNMLPGEKLMSMAKAMRGFVICCPEAKHFGYRKGYNPTLCDQQHAVQLIKGEPISHDRTPSLWPVRHIIVAAGLSTTQLRVIAKALVLHAACGVLIITSIVLSRAT
jgi:hypothetical protein